MIASAPNFARNFAGAVGTLLFAGLCVGAATAPAQAAPLQLNAYGERVMHVSYADLDISNPAGRVTLERRIRDAARNVCANSAPDPASAMQEYRCITNAVKAGQNATVAAIAAARTTG